MQALLGRCSTVIVPCIPCKGADLAPLILEAEPIDLVVIGNAANCSSWIGKAIAESTLPAPLNCWGVLSKVFLTSKWFDYPESICFVMTQPPISWPKALESSCYTTSWDIFHAGCFNWRRRRFVVRTQNQRIVKKSEKSLAILLAGVDVCLLIILTTAAVRLIPWSCRIAFEEDQSMIPKSRMKCLSQKLKDMLLSWVLPFKDQKLWPVHLTAFKRIFGNKAMINSD